MAQMTYPHLFASYPPQPEPPILTIPPFGTSWNIGNPAWGPVRYATLEELFALTPHDYTNQYTNNCHHCNTGYYSDLMQNRVICKACYARKYNK